MVRPIKEGLDYFPLDVDIDQDDKIALIEANHGLGGYAIVIRLLQKIYKNSYFYEWKEKEQLLFSRRINVDINRVNEIINDCVKWGVFSEELYEKHQILSSKGIQKRYLEATVRRKEVKVNEDYLLLDENEVNEYKNIVFVNINPLKDDISTQSREKKKKEKENKVKVEELPPTASDCDAITFYQNNFGSVSPFEKESILNWVDDFEEILVIEAMKKAIKSNKKSWGYAERILKNWSQKGIRTIKQVEEEKMEYRNQNSYQKPYYQNSQKTENVPDWFRERKRKQGIDTKVKTSQESKKKQKEVFDRFNKYLESNK